jgi:O-antigen/teichoic acid export membrane protein
MSSNRIFRPPGNALLSGAAWTFAGYLVRLAAQAVYFVVLARTLGPAQFGTFMALLAMVSIVAPFAGVGAGNLVVMHAARDQGELSERLGTAVVALATSATALGVGLLAVGRLVLPEAGGTGVVLLLVLAELFAVQLIELCGQAFQARDRLDSTAAITAMASVVRAAAVVVYAGLSPAPSAAGWAAWYLASTAGAAAVACAMVVARLGSPRFRRGLLRSSVREGLFFSIGSASKTVYSDVDKVMLSRIAGVDATGIYSAAYRLLSVAFAPVQALVFASNTRLYREGSRGPAAVLRFARAMTPGVLLYGAAMAALLFLAAPLLPFLLGEGYERTGEALRWLAVLPLVQGVHYLFGDALMGAGKQAARSGLQVTTACANVLLNLWLIPLYSWKGAAVASLLSELMLAAGVVWLLARLARQERSPRRRLLESGVSAGLAPRPVR